MYKFILLFLWQSSDVGGDVMLFNADCARDIVRIINHRRQLLLDAPSTTGKKFIAMYVCILCVYLLCTI